MPEQCPNCLSLRIGKNNYGKKTAGVIGALLGGATGASAGVILGDVLDERVLDNHRCLECGYSFSANSDSRDDTL